jgi:signal transduction histidine kinase
VVRRNAQVQARLIEDLLDMNRLMSGNVQLEVSPVDVGRLLQTTIQGLQPAADGNGVQLIASVDSTSGDVRADSKRLQQILWNLVHNAIKFTPPGGRVEIHIHQGDGVLDIIVEDNGRGIGSDFLPYVFERFRQEDTTMSGRTAGLGLGLSISKHLAELHGGTIQAHSAGPGTGATFVVKIPTAQDRASHTAAVVPAKGEFPASA